MKTIKEKLQLRLLCRIICAEFEVKKKHPEAGFIKKTILNRV